MAVNQPAPVTNIQAHKLELDVITQHLQQCADVVDNLQHKRSGEASTGQFIWAGAHHRTGQFIRAGTDHRHLLFQSLHFLTKQEAISHRNLIGKRFGNPE